MRLSTDAVAESMRSGWQLPAYLYSDPAVFELEKALIFRRSWIFVGLLARLSSVGDYITAQLGDVPIIVTRGADGELRGFVNACLHRLHPVAQGEGCTRLLQCKYHGWTYGLDGRLKTAPRSQSEEGFDRSDMVLKPIRVETFGSYVFANADLAAPPLAEHLGQAPELVAELGLDFGTWDHAGTLTYDVDANWKLFMENALECYHCDLVHHDTLAVAVATGPESYICDNYENVLTQVAPIQHAPAGETRSPEELDRFRLLFVWPSTAMSVDEYAGVISRLIPLGPRRCRFTVDLFAKPGTDPEVLADWIEMYDATFAEDKAVVSAQQAGYDSGMVTQGRVMPSNESSIVMFQQRTWRALAPALTEGR